MSDPDAIDERIAAYLDGMMSKGDEARFEADLETDPALAQRFERYTANDDLMRRAFDAPMQQPVDAVLVARMGLAATDRGQAVTWAANDNPTRPIWKFAAGGAIAAALALIVWLGLGRPTAGADGFSHALDSTPSGTLVALGDDATLRPNLSFAAADGRLCREFSLTGTHAGTGIACREPGGWRIEAATGKAVELAPSGRMATAAGADGDDLDAAYARLGAGDPFDAARESAAIANGWTRPEK